VRVLHIHKFFRPGSGAESYLFDLSALLESLGHEVIHFSMADPANHPSPQSRYFVSPMNYRGISVAKGLGKASRILGKTVYSFESKRKLAALLRDLRPDLAHLHIIDHHLSPSILHALRDARIPVVQTVHDYKLICPNYQLYVPRTGEICERCLPGKFYHCAGQRCMKDSAAASLLVTGAMYLHKAMRIYEDNVAAFLCSSDFLRRKLEQGGMPTDKLWPMPLYLDLARIQSKAEPAEYIVYAGRLVPEKGIGTLLRAMKALPQVRLVLLGDGPGRDTFEAQARELGLENVDFAGFLSGADYAQRFASARLLVLPSELYETFGLVVWEANALGIPAVGSRIGGIPEAILEGETGLLFKPGNAEDLAAKIREMLDRPDQARAMGDRGRARVEANSAAYAGLIEAVYAKVLNRAAAVSKD